MPSIILAILLWATLGFTAQPQVIFPTGGGGSGFDAADCDTAGGPLCLDAQGAINNPETALGEIITTNAGPPGATACLAVRHRIIDTTNLGNEYICPGGAGSTPRLSHTLSNAGPHSIEIPAGAMSVSGSCGAPTEETLIAGGPKRFTITCTDNDADSIEFDFTFVAADRWDAGTLQIQLLAYSVTNQTTEVFEMDFAGQCVRDGDPVAAHATTGEQAASVTFGNQANDQQISAASNAITLQGTCNATSTVYMRGQVDATASTYSPFTDLRILGVKVLYTSN